MHKHTVSGGRTGELGISFVIVVLSNLEAAISLEPSWIAVGVGLIAACLAAYNIVGKPLLRNRLLKRPVTMYCTVPARKHYDLGYVVQDDREHFVESLTLPSNSRCNVQFVFIARTTFTQSRVLFGFKEGPARHPEVLEYHDLYFRSGSLGRGRPGKPREHAMTIHDDYQIESDFKRIKGEPFTLGYVIQTRDPGRYTLYFQFSAEEVQSSYPFTVIVEDRPSTVMPCFGKTHSYCNVKPAAVVSGA